jgi:hypothetical protein
VKGPTIEKVIKSNIKLNNVCTLSDSTVYEQCLHKAVSLTVLKQKTENNILQLEISVVSGKY